MDEFTISVSQLKPDVISLSETWLSKGTENTLLALEGYDLYRSDRLFEEHDNVKRGGGLAIYVKQPAEVKTTYSYLNISNPSIEAQVLCIKYKLNKALVIVNIYRPPSGNKDLFYEQLNHIASTVTHDRYADVCFLGDFNLDHTPANKSEFTKKLEANLNLFGLIQIIKDPTRSSLKASTMIDVIYIKTNQKTQPFSTAKRNKENKHSQVKWTN